MNVKKLKKFNIDTSDKNTDSTTKKNFNFEELKWVLHASLVLKWLKM